MFVLGPGTIWDGCGPPRRSRDTGIALFLAQICTQLGHFGPYLGQKRAIPVSRDLLGGPQPSQIVPGPKTNILRTLSKTPQKFHFGRSTPPYGPYSAQRVQKAEICSKPKIIVYSQYCTLGRGDFGGKTPKNIVFFGFPATLIFATFLIAPIS